MKKSIIAKLLVLIVMTVAIAAMPVKAGESESVEAVEYYNSGLEYVNNNDFERAALAFQKAIQHDPEFADAYFNLGSLYEHFGDLQTAIRAYEAVITIEPRDYPTYLKLANLYFTLNMDKQALEFANAIPTNTYEYKQAQDLKNKINKPAAATTAKQPVTKPDNTTKATSAKPSAAKTTTKSSSASTPVSRTTAAPSQAADAYEQTMEGRTETGGYTDPDKSLLSKYTSPTGITIDNKGNVYVASFGDNSIYTVSPDGKNKLFSQSKMIDGPIGMDTDPQGNLYVANYNKDNILKITPSGNVHIFKSNVSKPYSIYISNGVLLVSEQGTNSVVMYKL